MDYLCSGFSIGFSIGFGQPCGLSALSSVALPPLGSLNPACRTLAAEVNSRATNACAAVCKLGCSGREPRPANTPDRLQAPLSSLAHRRWTFTLATEIAFPASSAILQSGSNLFSFATHHPGGEATRDCRQDGGSRAAGWLGGKLGWCWEGFLLSGHFSVAEGKGCSS